MLERKSSEEESNKTPDVSDTEMTDDEVWFQGHDVSTAAA